MKVTVYIPKKLNIEESDIPALKEKARRRLRLAGDREVKVRHIVEQARREGLIDIGKDYVLDLGEEAGRAARARRSKRRTNGHAGRRRAGREVKQEGVGANARR